MTYRQPAEWALHDWVWMGFPSNPDEWPEDFESARNQVAAFANAVHAEGRGEEVRVVAADVASADAARAMLHPSIIVQALPFGDVWLRDTGPIAVSNGAKRALVDFDFNGWGGSYDMPGDKEIGALLAAQTDLPCAKGHWIFEGGAVDTDGTGLAVTTEQCLLNPNRNPQLDRRKIETLLAGSLGYNDMLWLGDGLVNDHTDGHVDNLARFVGEGLLAIPEPAGEDDPNAAIYADAKARARAFGVEVVPMPSPGMVRRNGNIVPASYMNFYIGNAAVIVPIYDQPNDHAALDALRPFFPGRQIVGLMSDAILTGGGSFHCISQQMPS